MESDAIPNAAQPKPRRRWYQYSLRTLLIVVTAIGCGLGWLGIKVREARQQEAAVEAIQKLRGSVVYDYQIGPDGPIPDAAPPGPAWLHSLLGCDCFGTVRAVSFSFFIRGLDSPVKDGDLECLSGLTGLRQLFLDGTRVTDAGLQCLKWVPQLRALCLSKLKITDVGLEELNLCPELQMLDLQGTQITDAGLAQLQRLTKLEQLWLSGTNVTDAGLEKLTGLTRLTDLKLYGTKVTDEGVAKLRKALPNCRIFRSFLQ